MLNYTQSQWDDFIDDCRDQEHHLETVLGVNVSLEPRSHYLDAKWFLGRIHTNTSLNTLFFDEQFVPTCCELLRERQNMKTFTSSSPSNDLLEDFSEPMETIRVEAEYDPFADEENN